MGAYLPKPVTEKHSTDGEFFVGGKAVRYGVTAMQGWRLEMEVRKIATDSMQPYFFICTVGLSLHNTSADR